MYYILSALAGFIIGFIFAIYRAIKYDDLVKKNLMDKVDKLYTKRHYFNKSALLHIIKKEINQTL